ncbi:MAG: DNA repair ATPase [Verrucomicrobiota bacterium JB022]|nr:DNA repair ATPase [Verrucomicrobiota bacterium JB022]
MSSVPATPAPASKLEGGAYEVIRQRLRQQGAELQGKIQQLNTARQGVFGVVEPELLATQRITTDYNCVARGMVSLSGDRFLFGYNVQMGLRSTVTPTDVLAAFRYDRADRSFHPLPLEEILASQEFQDDFAYLYRYYRKAVFVKFMVIGAFLYMAFRISDDLRDIKVFKWLIDGDVLRYEGNRFEHEYQFPEQHQFKWTRAHRDMQRGGPHPHISIEDRLFVEAVGGDLTIKIEDNTEDGQGIYAEPVQEKDQTLDDAEYHYAILGSLILLKIKPYQEKQARHFIYNEKVKEVRRVDAIEQSCVLLPEDQGVIFANGYYLHNGEYKLFPGELQQMYFERVVKAPNGEDYLYVFYERRSGTYVLMRYNLIEQSVEAPIVCQGFTLFSNGELVYFKANEEPTQAHALQIWQTPFSKEQQVVAGQADNFLFKVGNAEIVRCLSALREISLLIAREDSYEGLYVDLVRLSQKVIDLHYWLDRPEAVDLKTTLAAVHATGQAAIDEFEKVQRIRKATQARMDAVSQATRKALTEAGGTPPDDIRGYVAHLARLRQLRGEIIGLRELRYVDLPAVDQLETSLSELSARVAQQTVTFLLSEAALAPYAAALAEHAKAGREADTVAILKEVEAACDETGAQLELLIDIVNNLKIDDATQATAIIDRISAIYADLNQLKVELRNRRRDMMRTEGVAQFNAQLKLLNQAVINYLDIVDSPERCEEYLTKLMVQLEELEGQFAEFPEFVEQITTKREEVYNAFQSRRMALQEARNQKAGQLMSAGERILKGIRSRVAQFKEVNEINGYFASDLMVDKVRNLIRQLKELGEPLKGDDLATRLKTAQGDAVRQLKDRQELFVDGTNLLQFGRHKFTVNQQELNLTTVRREGDFYYHLTGTQFFQRIVDEELNALRPVWDMELPSESDTVYRAEFLAYAALQALEQGGDGLDLPGYLAATPEARLAWIQRFMGPRYREGYSKGLHDLDARLLLDALVEIHAVVGLLRYDTATRACALVFWEQYAGSEQRQLLSQRLDSFATMRRLFPQHQTQAGYIREIERAVEEFCERTALFPAALAPEAARYLFTELVTPDSLTVSREAAQLAERFRVELVAQRYLNAFEEARERMKGQPAAEFEVIRDWLLGYGLAQGLNERELEYVDETAAHLLRGGIQPSQVVEVPLERDLEGLRGDHPVLGEGRRYHLHYNHFLRKLRRFEGDTMPQWLAFDRRKHELVETLRVKLRLDEFKPQVMSAFVRNRLLDEVFLPLIGDNLAKQIGTAGENTRTDRMGMLLLISPPGYGKTTLMEYVANRLGITFVKVNGPAIGHDVTSLDPSEARNASAREEVNKLNLAFEMGDNVMIYLDDIQHTNPELLQKFISLCDGQRKIEGVYNGVARTYDLRGKKVAVVMAGNPYTETGGRFQIPDMLANRADTYNLGDMVQQNRTAFEASYLENCLTSNPALSTLAGKAREDVYAVMRIAETGSHEGVDFVGNYSMEEVNEMVTVTRHLMRVRDTVLRVNLEYIRSAATADNYRTEPPFKLQGSYRNMNRMAEKVLPLMTPGEVDALVLQHYVGEAQTLTTGAESNLLKFREMEGLLTEQEQARWALVKERYVRNSVMGAKDQDPVDRVVGAVHDLTQGVGKISSQLETAVGQQGQPVMLDPAFRAEVSTHLAQFGQGQAQVAQLLERPLPPLALTPDSLGALRQDLTTLTQSLAALQGQVGRSLAPLAEAAQRPATPATLHLPPEFSASLGQLAETVVEPLRRLDAQLQHLTPSAAPENTALTHHIELSDDIKWQLRTLLRAFNRLFLRIGLDPLPESQAHDD